MSAWRVNLMFDGNKKTNMTQVAAEFPGQLPFSVRKVYVLRKSVARPKEESTFAMENGNGNHFIIAIHGTFVVSYEGLESKTNTFVMTSDKDGLYVPNDISFSIDDIDYDSIILILESERFANEKIEERIFLFSHAIPEMVLSA